MKINGVIVLIAVDFCSIGYGYRKGMVAPNNEAIITKEFLLNLQRKFLRAHGNVREKEEISGFQNVVLIGFLKLMLMK